MPGYYKAAGTERRETTPVPKLIQNQIEVLLRHREE